MKKNKIEKGVVRFPPEASLSQGNFSWRLSIADVAEPGAFSSFPGCDRWITVLDPKKSLALQVGKTSKVQLRFGEAFRFSGEETTMAEIPEGKLRDLSFVFRRETVKAEMKIVAFAGKPRSFSLTQGQVILFALEGTIAVSAYPGEHQFTLGPLDAVLVNEIADGSERLLLLETESGRASLAAIELK